MTIDEVIAKLKEYPGDWELMVNYQRIERIEPIEGRTSDGPGTINAVGDEHE